MSIPKTIVLTASLLVATSVAVHAHDTRPIDRAQAYQMQAIEEGRRNGSITRREYQELMSEQVRIADMERRAQADGSVNHREFRAIREAQRDAAAHISDESNDRQVNFWRRWRNRY